MRSKRPRRIRAVTAVDNFTRECLAIYVEQSIRGEHVVDIMERLKLGEQVVPSRVQVDNQLPADNTNLKSRLARGNDERPIINEKQLKNYYW